MLKVVSSTTPNTVSHRYEMPDNYIYLYHVPNDQGGTGVFIFIPEYADSVQDVQAASYASSFPLARSAPIYSYQNSGPRTLQVNFTLHRDMMKQLNYGKSNILPETTTNDDYTDVLIRNIQAAVLPAYDVANKMVNPPIVALRLGSDLFIKGVINGTVGLTYKYPILSNGKYAIVELGFQVSEIEPYDAVTVASVGSYRGISTNLVRNVWNAV